MENSQIVKKAGLVGGAAPYTVWVFADYAAKTAFERFTHLALSVLGI